MRRYVFMASLMLSIVAYASDYGTRIIPRGIASVGYRLTTIGSDYRPTNVDVLALEADASITFYRVRYGVVQKVIPNTSVYSGSSASFSLRESVPRAFNFSSSVDSVYVVRADTTAVDLTWW